MLFLYFDHLFFFNDTATTEIYTLSLHDALPILTSDYNTGSDLFPEKEQDAYVLVNARIGIRGPEQRWSIEAWAQNLLDRKSTRLNSSHANISYAVFCLKKKKIKQRL